MILKIFWYLLRRVSLTTYVKIIEISDDVRKVHNYLFFTILI